MKKIIYLMLFALLSLNVNAQYKVGDIYNKGGVKGLVVVVNESGIHGLLLSLESSELKWTSDDNLNLETSAFYEDDGMKNMDAIAKYIVENNKTWSNFPVFEWAKSLGEGWYIPAKEELLQIWSNLNGGNLKLNNAGKKNWLKHNKTIKKNKGDKLIVAGRGIDILVGMKSSTESDGGKIWAICPKGKLIALKALLPPNAKIELSEIEKNENSETKNILSATQKYVTRAVYKF